VSGAGTRDDLTRPVPEGILTARRGPDTVGMVVPSQADTRQALGGGGGGGLP
jgi:hypothetical protein